jgi:hypothetical protein
MMGGSVMHFIDGPGLSISMKIWVPYFEFTTSILFIVNLACYDQITDGEVTINRMVQSLNVFDQVANHPLLKGVGVILFLNKRDIFEKKSKKIPLKDFFPEYDGTRFVDKGKELSVSQTGNFIKKRFLATTKKAVAAHFTCATDTGTMKTIFDEITKSIIGNIASMHLA